jgi:hypothetical protein
MSTNSDVRPSDASDEMEEIVLSPKETKDHVANGSERDTADDGNTMAGSIANSADMKRTTQDGFNLPTAGSPARVEHSYSHSSYVNPSTTTLTSISTAPSISSSHSTLSPILITTALKTILNSKEAKRSQPLMTATTAALELVNAGKAAEKPRDIFEPLRLACETGNEKLLVASLDCTAKLISYGFFVDPNASPMNNQSQYASPPGSPTGSTATLPTSLADLVTHTITASYNESTPDAVSLQIVKALLQIVLSSQTLVHHSSLLKAVRTVYNIFLLSGSNITQNVAQGGLTQMVHHVFSRAQVDSGATSVWNHHGQDTTVPASSAYSTFSLSTPVTGTMDKKQDTTTPTTTDRETQHSMNGGPESGEVDDLTRAANIPLPPDEDEGGEEYPRFVLRLLREMAPD